MSILYVVGAGGIGCSIGYDFIDIGFDLRFVDTDDCKIEYGNSHGIIAIGGTAKKAKFMHFKDWSPTINDNVILATKCYDNSVVLDRIPAGARVIPAQNGYDSSIEILQHSTEMIVSYVVLCDPGTTRFRITRPGELHIGSRRDDGKLCEFGYGLVNANGILFSPVADIRPIKATKLMYNAAISPIAAAAGLDNGELLSIPEARKLFFALLQENYEILRAAEVPLGKVGPFHPRTVSRILKRRWLANGMARFFERSLRSTYCSMAGDIQKGRTELDNYTGHLLRLAEGRHDAPINRRVYEVVSRMTRGREPSRREVIAELSR